MFRVGDKVKLNIDVIEKNGMSDGDEQIDRFEYIKEHPDEVYVVMYDSIESYVSAQYVLDHPILRPTSFFEDELILIERGEQRYELSK